MKKLLIFDEFLIVAFGLTQLLNSHLDADIDMVTTKEEAEQKLREGKYHLFVLDTKTANDDNLDYIRQTKAAAPEMKIIVFSALTNYSFVKKYLDAGIAGYLTKQANLQEITDAFRSVLSGQIFLDQKLLNQLIQENLTNSLNPFDTLSDREIEIVPFLLKAEPLSVISEKLKIHVSTVGTFKGRIFRKLQVRNILEMRDLASRYNIP
ncbi:response regulator [Siphonobacter aquaeclarae]|jgi:two-component system invasion response regulator UvrY|uniref:Two component transcriptional regulator, LuxR family n=1 Tax=Siphonobacter aquaeclarae TaxID=563176 RepID=A0A1G9YRW7_9BACT|nr:response regulator transcription factor [Siphonobacter aquaeclarae]SDN11375.1 two component transcriptional regulator, LuxR family [Siphonobacter aquaeclarae]